VGEEATIDGPARRRTSWSLKAIVEDVAGRPIGELQDPSRPVHPYLKVKGGGPVERPATAPPDDEPYDPVENLYPPLVGPIGRGFHGSENEHHRETLERHRPLSDAGGRPVRPPGPLHRPERLYLHYLLLHMDRLNDSALRYLRLAVEEELAHRAQPLPAPEPPAETVAPPESSPSP
jgi:hypothetical protein